MNVLFAFNKRITSCINEWYSSSFSTHTEWLLRQLLHPIDTVFLCCLLPALWLGKTRRIRRTTFANTETWNIHHPIFISFCTNKSISYPTECLTRHCQFGILYTKSTMQSCAMCYNLRYCYSTFKIFSWLITSPVSASIINSSVPDIVTRLTYHLAWSLPWGEKLIRNGVLEKLLCCPLPFHKSIQPWLSNQRSNSLGFILSPSNFLSSFSSLISFPSLSYLRHFPIFTSEQKKNSPYSFKIPFL